MSNNLPPLSGAILVSNPRTSNMAIAFNNPNDRRRINLITRFVMKSKGVDAIDGVQIWLADKDKPSSKRRIRRAGTKGKRGAAFAKAGGLASLKPQSKARKAQYARTQREVASALAALGEGYSPSKGRRGRKVSYAGRATGTHASRYKKHNTDSKWDYSRKSSKGKTLKGRRVSVAGVQAWNAKRSKLRAAAGRPRLGNATQAQLEEIYGADSGLLVLRGFKDAKPRKKSTRKKKRAASNPSHSALVPAFNNPAFAGILPFVTGYALPVTAAGIAAGGLQGFVAGQGWTDSLAEMLPEALEPGLHTIQGLLIGSVLAAGAGALGVKTPAGAALAMIGGCVFAIGGATDAINWFSADDFSDASDNGGLALSGLALDNMGGLALDNSGYGDLGGGMAYETAPLIASGASIDFGQASLADAYHSGADFSAEEGQALLNGPAAYGSAFGAPAHRVSHKRGPSHLAGRRGHRWGWLVKMVGWDKARQICALPPQKRVQVIKKMRSAALRTFQHETASLSASATAATSPTSSVSGSGLGGAHGASGPGASYGAALFMGAN